MPLAEHAGWTIRYDGDHYGRAVTIVDENGDILALGGSGGTSSTDDAAFTVGASSLTPVGGIVTNDPVDNGDAGAFAMLANRQQKVTLYDSSGNELAVGGGAQYTEDAAAAGNPVGNALIVVRDDARGGSLTSTDGDNVALRGTNAGEVYVKHVDAIPVTDNGGSLTVDGTVAVTHAALTELAAAIDTEVQVDVVGALPAGDNNIGNVDVASLPALPAGTNNIGDVDILSVVPGTGATSLGKAEDAAHSSGDTGVMMLVVRQDSQSDLGADGDYVPLTVDADGNLRVTGGGAGGGSTQYDEDTASDDAQKLTMAGVTRADTAASQVDSDGDRSTLIVDASGRLHVNVGTGSVTANAGTNLNTSALALESGGNLATIAGAVRAEDAAHSTGHTGIMALTVRQDTAAALSGTDGDYQPPITDGSGRLHVNVGNTVTVASHAVTNAGTFAVQDATAQASLSVLDDWDESDRAKVNPIAGQAGVQGGSGSVTALTQRVVLATDVALPAGTNAIGKLAANSGVDIGDVDITSIAAGTNAIGNVGLIGRASGGLSSYTTISTAAVLSAEIKGSAGQVFDIECFNVSTAPIYVRIYNQTGAPGSGDAANIIWRGMIPANADADAAGFLRVSAIGRACSNGIGIRASGAIADNDTTALSANVAFFNVGYA